MICPKCRQWNCRRSHRHGLGDSVATLAGLRPWRCRVCEKRFYARSVPVRFALYAHCSECGNLDLQRIERSHVTEGLARWLWRLLRVPAYRCAPCRYRFFSPRAAFPRNWLPRSAVSSPATPDKPAVP